MQGSASDSLIEDPVVPSVERAIDKPSTNGSISNSFSDLLPIPLTDYGYPGTVTQVRGLGRTVEDTNVEALGVPLNLPQGGGFDLSTFPQFFWSSYEFRLGPGGMAFDPRASTGVISLKPWTAQAIDGDSNSSSNEGRFTLLAGRSLGQISAAARYGDVAFLMGGTFGQAHGPTGSFSVRLPDLGSVRLRAHLLATSIDASTPGPTSPPSFFSPNARQTSARLAPILEGSADLGGAAVLKSSAFFDRSWINYENPDQSYSGVTRADQYGIENAIVSGPMTYGVTAKHVVLTGTSYSVPDESSLNLRAGPTLRFGSYTLDGYIGADAVSGTGWEPAATLGLRESLPGQVDIYTRGSYSWRFPTLTDRYAEIPPYSVANSGLSPEQVMSWLLGSEFRSERWHWALEGMAQFRNRAQLYISDPVTYVGQTVNAGHTDELSLMPSMSWDAWPELQLFQSARFSSSQVASFNDQRIPYDPFLTYVAEARFHARGESPLWRANLGMRALSSAPSDYANTPLPGYALAHMDLEYRLGKVTLQGRIENLLGRDVQVTAGYPLPGRLFVLGAVGEI